MPRTPLVAARAALRSAIEATGEAGPQRTASNEGQAPRIKVYDKAAPSQRPAAVPTPELQRSRERPAPAPAR
jgi:hypothetical protein